MIRINLLKAEKKEFEEKPIDQEPEVKEKKRVPSGSLILVLIVILLAALAFVQRRSLVSERNTLDNARQEQKRLQTALQQLELVEQQKLLLEQKIALIHQLKLQQSIPIKVMSEISKSLPDWVWLTETSYEKQKLLIKGRALSNNLIADYMSSLEKSGLFSAVNIISSTQKTTQNSQYMEFALNASYLLPPELQPPAKTPEQTKKGKSQ
jgi:type IV pilus assembly protein PilN